MATDPCGSRAATPQVTLSVIFSILSNFFLIDAILFRTTYYPVTVLGYFAHHVCLLFFELAVNKYYNTGQCCIIHQLHFDKNKYRYHLLFFRVNLTKMPWPFPLTLPALLTKQAMGVLLLRTISRRVWKLLRAIWRTGFVLLLRAIYRTNVSQLLSAS